MMTHINRPKIAASPRRPGWSGSLLLGAAAVFAACNGHVGRMAGPDAGGDAGPLVPDGGDPGTGGGRAPAAMQPIDAGTAGPEATGGAVSPPPEAPEPGPPAAICEPPVDLYDVADATVVGTGTAESCSEAGLRDAVAQAGAIRFDCGSEPTVIVLQDALQLRIDRDTIIDGGGTVTLDAAGQTRHFFFSSPNWQTNPTKVVLQRLTLRNGHAPRGMFFPQRANPDCAYGYKDGSGGAIFMRDGNLEIIDCQFLDNEAAPTGPDVGGGAIYAVGSGRIVISGSRFERNRGANGGAIGMLHSTLEIYNSHFISNRAEGRGLNFRVPDEAGCPAFNHESQGGAGGLAGAVYADGLDAPGHVFVICGAVFRDNRANEMAGAVFRTPNRERREMRIDRSTFESNSANLGGVSFIKDNHVVVRDSLFSGNRAGVLIDGTPSGGAAGGLWINRGTVDVLNSTFHDNAPGGLIVDNRATPGDDRPPDAGPEAPGGATNVTFFESDIEGALQVENSLLVGLDCPAALSGENNLQWPEGPACIEDAVFADPKLAPLQRNGGPTATMMPQAEAIAGIAADCPNTDQRGQPRTTCAAGAVEP